jgi:CRP/FNR family transcriptional regulator
MIPVKPDPDWQGPVDCCACGMRDQSLFADLDDQDFALIRAPIDPVALKAGEVLFSEGAAALGVFTLREGLIKLVRVTHDGRQRIVRLQRPFDVVGLEALSTGHYESTAVALTDIALCRLPLSVIHHLGTHSPHLHQRLTDKWHDALKQADDWLADLNFGSARQRVAQFILKMRDPADPALCTLFSREDMGAMLDLKLETVSREVAAFTRERVIEPLDKQGRRYRIADLPLLQSL